MLLPLAWATLKGMQHELTQDQIESILKGVSIPPQPQVMVDLQMEQMNPNCNIDTIARLISQDVGLAGSILKTVNSPFYHLSNHITSIGQAVSILGVNSVVNLVNAQSIKGALSDEDIIAMGRFWDNAMDVAMASAVIARQVGFPNPDEAYTLGLFHNAGIPLLSSRYSDYAKVVELSYAEEEKAISDIENEQLGTNHCVVGYYVGKSWHLPKYLCEAIHDHHKIAKVFTEETSNSQKKTLLAILKMAEHICGTYKTLGNQDINHEWNRNKDTLLVYIGLSAYEFDSLELQISEMGLGTTDYYS